MQKDRSQRHFEAVRATLPQGQENYGTLQRPQKKKYEDPVYAEINTVCTDKRLNDMRFSEYRSIPAVQQRPVSYDMCSTDFGMSTLKKNKSTPDMALQPPHSVMYCSREQTIAQAIAEQDGVSTLRKAKSNPAVTSADPVYMREQGIALRPDGLPYRAAQMSCNDTDIYRSRGFEQRPDISLPCYTSDTLDSRQTKHRPRRPATAHECNAGDFYEQRDTFAVERNRKANADYFNAVQKQGVSSIPLGYRTASYRIAVTSPRHSKLLAALPTARCDVINECDNKTVSSSIKKKTDVQNDDYVSMENLTNLLSTRTQAMGGTALSGQRQMYDVAKAQRAAKPVPMPPQTETLKGILKNRGKYTVNNNIPRSTAAMSEPIMRASTVERNGFLLTSFPLDESDVTSSVENTCTKPTFKGTVIQHTAQVHRPSLPLNPINQCKANSLESPDSDPKNWPAPPPPLECVVESPSIPQGKCIPFPARPAPPVPKKTSPRREAVPRDISSKSNEKTSKESNEPSSSELLDYLRRLAKHGPDRSPSKCSQDSDAMTLESESSRYTQNNFSEDDYFSDDDEFDDFDETECDDDDDNDNER